MSQRIDLLAANNHVGNGMSREPGLRVGFCHRTTDEEISNRAFTSACTTYDSNVQGQSSASLQERPHLVAQQCCSQP